MRPSASRRRPESGFSLIEVLIAVAIIALMGGIVAFRLFPHLLESQVDRAKLDIDNLRTAVEMFQMKEHRLPSEGEWPRFLFEGSDGHAHPYVDEHLHQGGLVKDPWGSPYVYQRLSGVDYSILSYGPDKLPGGGDDVPLDSK
ncbi:MAG: hypothetical protein CMJ83_13340 [Planctomycetes bacterium]|nr:hypothetical protein [Planctomycetota bacterium]